MVFQSTEVVQRLPIIFCPEKKYGRGGGGAAAAAPSAPGAEPRPLRCARWLGGSDSRRARSSGRGRRAAPSGGYERSGRGRGGLGGLGRGRVCCGRDGARQRVVWGAAGSSKQPGRSGAAPRPFLVSLCGVASLSTEPARTIVHVRSRARRASAAAGTAGARGRGSGMLSGRNLRAET